jgi:hypothetical protein
VVHTTLSLLTFTRIDVTHCAASERPCITTPVTVTFESRSICTQPDTAILSASDDSQHPRPVPFTPVESSSKLAKADVDQLPPSEYEDAEYCERWTRAVLVMTPVTLAMYVAPNRSVGWLL